MRKDTQHTDIDPARIEEATRAIDPVFLNSPQYVDERLCAALGGRVTVKLETLNPVRSFKGRGADHMLSQLAPGSRVVCASAGNFGQAVAYAGRSRAMAVRVMVAEGVNPDKRARMEALGARVTVAGTDSSEAREAAGAFARNHPDHVFIEDGRQPAITEGAGTIGLELEKAGPFDVVVLPVGDGALISGVARWLAERAPATRVIGVNPVGAPAMERSWRAGRAVALDRVDTVADGISIRTPIDDSVRRVCALVDDMVLVDDAALGEAARLAATALGVLLEPAGAAGLAAIATHGLAAGSVATVLTGANPRPEDVASLVG